MNGPRDAAPPLNIRAPLAGFGLSVKRKRRAGGTIGRPPGRGRPAPSGVPYLETDGHHLPAFLGHPAARRGLEAPFGERAALRRLEERSEEHTSELQSLMRISYAVFCLKKKNIKLIYRER